LCNFTIPVQATGRQRFLNFNMILKEQQQLRKIRNGDIDSFEKLFHRYYQGLFGYAKALVHAGEIAEEVVQDVFYNIWKNRDSLRITRSWQSYLYRSVYNNSMMVLRRHRREYITEEGTVPEQGTGALDPSQEMQYRELSDLVAKTIEELPDRTREIFLLSRHEGLKYREIAEKLAISVKTVEANMGKALNLLRNSLEKYRQE
jgi:RNA polymerase sigma-70 factor (ECF subfamily)